MCIGCGEGKCRWVNLNGNDAYGSLMRQATESSMRLVVMTGNNERLIIKLDTDTTRRNQLIQ